MRLFVALRPPAAVADALNQLAVTAAAQFGGRVTRAETLHLTLGFLGDVPDERLSLVDAACRCVAGEARLSNGGLLHLDKLACWPQKQLIWAGCQTVPEGLPEVARRLALALETAGFPGLFGRPFVPHLTLVRRVREVSMAQPEACADILLATCPTGIVPWCVNELVLVESTLLADGPAHRIVGRYPFALASSAGLVDAGDVADEDVARNS